MGDYSESGFDGFLSRSIDNLTQVTLDSQGPVTTSQRFDSTQVSGMLGDTLKIGSILLDGSKGKITITDTSGNVVVILGELD